jgi:hypothetical protein
MAKNRKNQSAAIRFGPALKALLLCLLIGGSGVGYVWQKNQIFELGKQIKKREVRLQELEGQNEKLRTQLATLRSSTFLERRVRELNLGLAMPQQNQIWRLPEPAPAPVTSSADRQYASQSRSLDTNPAMP